MIGQSPIFIGETKKEKKFFETSTKSEKIHRKFFENSSEILRRFFGNSPGNGQQNPFEVRPTSLKKKKWFSLKFRSKNLSEKFGKWKKQTCKMNFSDTKCRDRIAKRSRSNLRWSATQLGTCSANTLLSLYNFVRFPYSSQEAKDKFPQDSNIAIDRKDGCIGRLGSPFGHLWIRTGKRWYRWFSSMKDQFLKQKNGIFRRKGNRKAFLFELNRINFESKNISFWAQFEVSYPTQNSGGIRLRKF